MPAPKRLSLSAEEAISEIATTISVIYFLLLNWLDEKNGVVSSEALKPVQAIKKI